MSPSELLKIEVRAAKLFAGIDGKGMLRQVEAKTTADTGPKRGVTGGGRFTDRHAHPRGAKAEAHGAAASHLGP